jgi:hypothetical protein
MHCFQFENVDNISMYTLERNVYRGVRTGLKIWNVSTWKFSVKFILQLSNLSLRT